MKKEQQPNLEPSLSLRERAFEAREAKNDHTMSYAQAVMPRLIKAAFDIDIDPADVWDDRGRASWTIPELGMKITLINSQLMAWSHVSNRNILIRSLSDLADFIEDNNL